MLVNMVSLFMLLFMVFADSNPAFSKTGDEGRDKPSRITKYHSLVSERKSDDYTIKVDLSGQILTLEIPESQGGGVSRFGGGETRLYPTPDISSFVSASILSAKAKQFDDGLCA
ncbi:MAG: hypothetical protein ABSH41_21815, partial [Syntrophobacteraceae bacterium]